MSKKHTKIIKTGSFKTKVDRYKVPNSKLNIQNHTLDFLFIDNYFNNTSLKQGPDKCF
jgi:hypothetical protein